MGVVTFKPNSSDPTVDVEVDGIRLSAAGSSGTKITQIRAFSVSFNAASVAAAITVEQTVAVVGLATTDRVFINNPLLIAGVGIVGCRVTAADTLGITLCNTTAGALDPGAITLEVLAIRTA